MCSQPVCSQPRVVRLIFPSYRKGQVRNNSQELGSQRSEGSCKFLPMDGDKTFSVGTAASRRSVWRGGKMTWANRGCRVFEKTCTWSLVPEDTRCCTSTLCTTSCSWNILNWQLQLENWVENTFTFSSVLTQVIPLLCAGVNRRYRAALRPAQTTSQAVLRCRSGDAFHSSRPSIGRRNRRIRFTFPSAVITAPKLPVSISRQWLEIQQRSCLSCHQHLRCH